MSTPASPRPLCSICVFAGSSPGARPAYRDAVVALGEAMAAAGLRLVYGGASVGLMGVLADTVLAHGGDVLGVIPEALSRREVAHQSLPELRVVGSMHERKAMMADAADAFIALPGGLGTLEELFEVLTWSQLGFHQKPAGVLNVDGFYEGMQAFLDHCVTERFIRAEHRAMLISAREPAALLAALSNWEAPQVTKWLDSESRL